MTEDNREYTEDNLYYDLNEQYLISPLDSEPPIFFPKIRLGILLTPLAPKPVHCTGRRPPFSRFHKTLFHHRLFAA